MDQFVEEVQEEWRRDQLIQIWKRYGNFIIAVCLIILGLAIGKAILNYYQDKQNRSHTEIFERALSLVDIHENTKAIELFDDLIKEGSVGYKTFATFHKVNLTEVGDDKIKLLHSIIRQNDIPKIYKDLASYYIMIFKFDNTRVSDYLHELNDYTTPQNYFANYFLELKVLSYIKLKQFSKAQEIAQAIIQNKEISALLRTRIMALLNYIQTIKE